MFTADAHSRNSDSLRDLLDREPAAQALVEAIFSAVPTGLTIASVPDVEILRVSDYGSRLLQRRRDVLEHISVEAHSDAYQVRTRDGERVPPENLPLTRATAGEVVEGLELVLIAEDGRHLDILCNAGPIRDSEGSILGGVIAWTDITTQKRLQEQLAEALYGREVLMKEMHHRIKNHLAIAAALAALQARNPSGDAASELEKFGRRLQVIATVHDQFYSGDYGESVEAAAFLSKVCDPLASEHVKIAIDVDEGLYLTPEQAAPVGMIASEAVCNSLKHAFPSGESGRILVRLTRDQGNVQLTVDDDGRGMAPDAATRASGSRLNVALARQVGGRLTVGESQLGGARVALTF